MMAASLKLLDPLREQIGKCKIVASVQPDRLWADNGQNL